MVTSLRTSKQAVEQIHAFVYGLVQGVYYRATLLQRAQEMGVKGWIRNRADGTVETLAQGSRPTLQRFIQALHQGSPASQVSHVEVEWQAPSEAFSTFLIR